MLGLAGAEKAWTTDVVGSVTAASAAKVAVNCMVVATRQEAEEERWRSASTLFPPKHNGRFPPSSRVASHLFTGGFAGIGKLPALFGWYIRYGKIGRAHV